VIYRKTTWPAPRPFLLFVNTFTAHFQTGQITAFSDRRSQNSKRYYLFASA